MTATITEAPLTAERRRLRFLLRQIDLDEQMRRRSVQAAILHASAWWWRWRAEQFQQARPRPDDFNGNATPAELAEADRRCVATAHACLNRARMLELEEDSSSD
jgi:hypothetical protein